MTRANLAACTLAATALLLAACSSTPQRVPQTASTKPAVRLPDASMGVDVVVFALGLVDTGYRFGGRNPQAGLDCSGMVSYVMEQVAGVKLPHNAAQIASQARPIERDQMRPGDLVFFNTMKRPFSHMGIYIGDGRFVHAPSTNGAVRVERLDSAYFAQRFEGARTLLD
ncbi:C40 family peptidase [Niveibacterium sp. 24ML]|uniref:C40 family peptidase n=1 Tax=Niveibacterium sp. 24ML TaxID=2985512 RepID=UPI00226DCA7C|nr:C40 family peptidase [Niveibacterium sp. 24ML]MCX9156922.1 C40 family peptidase [Niveibacterium sp. 24ML]